MKKIDYPPRGSADFVSLLNDYSSLFESDMMRMETGWASWKENNNVLTINESVSELLVADVDELADVYEKFVALHIPLFVPGPEPDRNIRNPILTELDKIFKYDGKYDNKIAVFFIDHASQLHISSCYYCDMAYINTYLFSSPGHVTAPVRRILKRQFDVDHFLPKSICPIIGLSLFNFVPACQVCNSRIKGADTVGLNKTDRIRFNPAGENYAFDANVNIHLRMKGIVDTSFTDPDKYYIDFHCLNGFDREVEFFHLEERYEFHKCEALRLKRLKARYPRSTIRQIALLLGKTQSELREDIFHKKFLTANGRCFTKFTLDILK